MLRASFLFPPWLGFLLSRSLPSSHSPRPLKSLNSHLTHTHLSAPDSSCFPHRNNPSTPYSAIYCSSSSLYRLCGEEFFVSGSLCSSPIHYSIGVTSAAFLFILFLLGWVGSRRRVVRFAAMACTSVCGAVVSFAAVSSTACRSSGFLSSTRASFVNVPSARPSVRPRSSRRVPRIVAMASLPSLPDELIKKVKESIAVAQEVCTGNETSEECVVAWDEVEELSAEAAHQRARTKAVADPLETYCADNPESDECRVYED